MAKFENIIYEKRGSSGIITLSRPDKMNALSLGLALELGEVVDEADQDEEVRVVILTGGKKLFCAGADIEELSTLTVPSAATVFLRGLGKAFDKIGRELSKPIIAAVAGAALGGGLELCLACDIRIAAENATFGFPEVTVGVIPAAGGTQRLPRIVGIAKATEMILSGKAINAEEAYRIGLVNKVVPLDKLMDEAEEMANMLAKRAPLSLKAAKSSIKMAADVNLDSGLNFELLSASALFASEDTKEGIRAFVEKRKPVFKGK